MSGAARVPAERLRAFTAGLFERLGVPPDDARRVADDLVDSDLEGIASHGVMLAPMYAERLRAGSVAARAALEIVSDRDGAVVMDAHDALGQVSSQRAVELCIERAMSRGFGAVAVRNAFHFGTAGRWAQAISSRGMIGVVMSNTRPLMPPPGGAERVVGNNPLAIALPSSGDGPPVVLDMAMSATAMGRIRLADAAGRAIPEGWAADAQGNPTTDPAAAIKGMLLPAAGPKGFGLAFMIDLICGALSSGAFGDAVRPLYGDARIPYGCAHFFLAIDVSRFRDPAEFAGEVGGFARRVRESKPAPGTDRVMSPGEPAWRARQNSAGLCALAPETMHALAGLAKELGVPAAGLFPPETEA